MANRYTDSDKWKKQFIKSLPPEYKLLWLYVCDDCNHAGIWEVDIEIAELRTGVKLDAQVAEKYFADKIIVFDGGEKWFIPSFIFYQYGGNLSPTNRMHMSVIKILKKYKLDVHLIDVHDKMTKDCPEVEDSPKDKDKDKDNDMYLKNIESREKKNSIDSQHENLQFPETHENEWRKLWLQWVEYKRVEHNDRYKSEKTQQTAINHLVKISNNDVNVANEIVTTSIANRWKGTFENKKNNNNGNAIKQQFASLSPQQRAEFARRALNDKSGK